MHGQHCAGTGRRASSGQEARAHPEEAERGGSGLLGEAEAAVGADRRPVHPDGKLKAAVPQQREEEPEDVREDIQSTHLTHSE